MCATLQVITLHTETECSLDTESGCMDRPPAHLPLYSIPLAHLMTSMRDCNEMMNIRIPLVGNILPFNF